MIKIDYKKLIISIIISLIIVNLFILGYGYLNNYNESCRYKPFNPCEGTFDPVIEKYRLGYKNNKSFNFEPSIIIFIVSNILIYKYLISKNYFNYK